MNKRRKAAAWVASGLLAAAIGFTAVPVMSAAETEAISIYVDGERSELSAKSIGGVPYLALETAAAFGGSVKADRDGKTFTVSADSKEVRFTVGEEQRFVDGSPVSEKVVAKKEGTKVYVPASWLSDSLQFKIVNDRFTDAVYIFKQKSGGKLAATAKASGAVTTTQEAAASSVGPPAGGAAANANGGSAGSGIASTTGVSGNGNDATTNGNGAGASPAGNGTGAAQSGNGIGTAQSGNGTGASPTGNGTGTAQSGNGTGTAQSGNGTVAAADGTAGAGGSGANPTVVRQEPGPSAAGAAAGENGNSPATGPKGGEYVAPAGEYGAERPTLTAIRLEGDSLRVETSGAVKANVFSLKSPERIVLDLPNATIARDENGKASGGIAVAADHPYIQGIRYSLFATEPSTVRIVIDLKSAKPYSLKQEEYGTVLHFTPIRPIRVILDAGHGGNDPGAISATGRFEKDATLPIASMVFERLQSEKLIQPAMIRDDDTYISPVGRAAAANKQGADLFISIHANTASSSSVKGTETYYWREDSLEFANVIHEALLQTFGSADRKVKKERFVVVKDTTMPAVLLELGFLTNKEDEAKLYDEQMQQRIADAIVAAIKKHFHIP